jgi:hypothetical protein
VAERWQASDWFVDGDYRTVRHTWEGVTGNAYLRVRGTNGRELVPEPDPRGEDPWADLWFYSNPIFVQVR